MYSDSSNDEYTKTLWKDNESDKSNPSIYSSALKVSTKEG